MRLLLIPALALLPMLLALSGIASLAAADHVFIVGTTKVQFTLPDHWSKAGATAFGDAYLYTDASGKRYSLMVNKQPNSKGIANLKTAYERDFPKGFKDFKLVASDISTVNEREVLLIQHTNTMPGAPIRQFFYIVELGDPSVSFTFSELEDIGNALHAEYAAVVASLKKLE